MANCNSIWRPYLAEISEEEDVQDHLQPGTSNEVNLKTKQIETTFLDTTVYKGERFEKERILDVRTHFKPTETFQ